MQGSALFIQRLLSLHTVYFPCAFPVPFLCFFCASATDCNYRLLHNKNKKKPHHQAVFGYLMRFIFW